jgi:hypothetical protein
MGGVKNGELTFKTQKRGGTMKQKKDLWMKHQKRVPKAT